MKPCLLLLAFAASLGLCEGTTFATNAQKLSGSRRALPNSPSGGYAPKSVPCPANSPRIREATSLSASETAWLKLRRKETVDPMISWLSRMNISDFDAASYINKIRDDASTMPNIGIAISGGGYRAMLNGAGFLAAADIRTDNSTNTGHIGGLLQATTYLAGLSGGGWLVGSIYTNNFSSVQTLRDGSTGSSVWQFENSILKGPKEHGIEVVKRVSYLDSLYKKVQEKTDAGFDTTITDYWGRGLSYQLVNATDGGPAYTFSSIALQDNFMDGSIPFPFLVADSRAPGTTIISLNSTIFEINPFELGSWDPTAYAFAPLRYVGSNFSAGSISTDGQCVEGFDQAGFVIGTSSSLFNQFILHANKTDANKLEREAATKVLEHIGKNHDDIAVYEPNPFFNYKPETNRYALTTGLTLVDGGEDGQNIPLYPLIQPQRGVDVIFAIDSTSDTKYHWPNGSALIATYQRSINQTIQKGTAFPLIPDENTFVNQGLNNRPTFFGCDSNNSTADTPLIVYLPNAPYSSNSNFSTFKLSYTDDERDSTIHNGYEIATVGNGTLDSQWPTCMACAVLSRSFTKTRTAVPKACQTCFNRYCWNGTLSSSSSGNYAPNLKIDEASTASSLQTGMYIIVAVAAATRLL